MREVDRILRARAWPTVAARGYSRQGRRFYKENVNEDMVQVWFRPMLSERDDESSLRVSMVLQQGISRRIIHYNADPLPNTFSETGQWALTPEVPVRFRHPRSSVIWDDIEQQGFEEVFEEQLATVWFPLMDLLIEPGAISRELLDPSGQYPGRFTPRSEVNIALSLLNDRDFSSLSKSELVDLIVQGRPVIADRMRLMYPASFTDDQL